jgi:hypothetical protein
MNQSLLSILLFPLFSVVAVAQELLPQRYDTTVFHHDLQLEGMGYHHSSHLRNDFTGKLLFGGMISEEIKLNSQPNLLDNVRIGGELNYGLTYRHGAPLFAANERLGWLVKAANFQQFGAGFTEGVYNLALFGNEPYLGEDVVFSNTSAFYQGFYKFGFGLYDREKKHSVTLNLLLGQGAFNLFANRGILAFSEDGETMDYNVDVKIEQTFGNTVFAGIGAAVDFEIHAPIKDVPGLQGVFQVSGRNIGFMHNANVREWNLTAAGSYSGFGINEFSELLTYNEAQFNEFLDSLGFTSTDGSRTSMIPGGFIQAGKIVSDDIDAKFQSFFGFRVLTNLIHKPMVYAGGHYAFNDWGAVGLQASFGGYGAFRVGVYGAANFGNFSLGLGSEDIIGWVYSGFWGRSVVTRLTWRI